MIEYRPIRKEDLPGVVALCAVEGWPSFVEDPDRAWRALTAPGITTFTAVDGEAVVGFVQMQSDGEIQAHLSLVLVARDRRRRSIATKLVREAFAVTGAERIDLATDADPGFYRSFTHQEWKGFRLHPQYNRDETGKR
ncbi:MAG: GNAT family N-acetyltransferase [Planctomycetota bacterium]|jgi:ribosomal protein S18 acetylase RimI-like enzyme